MKKTILDVDVRGQRVLCRLDLNVPIDGDGRIVDDRRIVAARPTVRRIIQGGGRVILMSHLGRPKDNPGDREKYSLAPVAERLSKLIDQPVRLLPDCIGSEIEAAVDSLSDGEVCMLENLRFHKAETIKDNKAAEDSSLRTKKDDFARGLANLADVYVNDAFGTCHRDNASMLTVPEMLVGKPRVVGYLVQKELAFLGKVVSNPAEPFVCILGGAKVSDKLGVIRSLLGKCDKILIGGAMAYTFLAAKGEEVGKSLVEPDLFVTARNLLESGDGKIVLPVDSIGAVELREGVDSCVCDNGVASDLMGLDIGPKTIELFSHEVAKARTIVWNGPMGVFEVKPFDTGTVALAKAIADATASGAESVVGGGDSAAAIDQAGVADLISHVSTGGGASLEFLEGRNLAAIDVLDRA